MQFSLSLTFFAADVGADHQTLPVITLSLARAVWFHQRMRGLLFHPAPPSGNALLIERCNSVHTVGMRYPLDLVFLDRARRVVGVRHSVPPNRLLIHGGLRAASVLEATSGWLPLHLLRPGTQAVISEG